MIRRSVLGGLSALGASAAIAAATKAANALTDDTGDRETIAILGTGHLGSTFGQRLTNLGYPVVYGSRSPNADRITTLVRQTGRLSSAASLKDATARANIVVFALPWEPVNDLVPTLGDLTDKLVIDPMNTKLDIVNGYPDRPSVASVAEQLQSLLPGAHVVKAFNTILDKHLADPASAGGVLSIPMAATDRNAKGRVARLISELGFEPVDTGPLIAARYLEDLLRLEVGYVMYNKGKMFELYMRPVPGR